MDELEEIRGLPKRRRGGRGGRGAQVLSSAITAAVVSVATVMLLQRYPIPWPGDASADSDAESATGEGREVEVPDLVGLPVEAAPRVAAVVELAVEVAEERPDDEVPADRVILQSHVAGSSVEPGTVLRLVISTGPASVEVPALVGRSLEEARAALGEAGLSAGEVQEGGEGEAGAVTAAEPAPGTEVEPGTAVALTVAATGVPVPRVVNRPLRRARELLREAGFTIGRTSNRFDPDHGPFVVLGQDPAPETLLAPGSEVALVVNQGP